MRFFDPRLCLALLCALLSPGISQAAKGAYAADPSNDEMVEAPTAYTLLHGGYDLNLRMYEGGGIVLRGNIGFKRFLQFGFSGNATNIVGHGDIRVEEPRLGLKLKPFSQGRLPFSLALGWDDRGYGRSHDRRFFPGLQKGLYMALSREFKSAGNLQTHAGFNVVRPGEHYDSNRDLGVFAGISFAISRSIFLASEFDKLTTDFWQFNSGFQVGVGNSMRIGMDFRDINRSDYFARILRLQYLSFF